MSSSRETFSLDKRQVRRAFDRAALTYDQAAVLQLEVGTRLLERLQYILHIPQTILDIGSGTGKITTLLSSQYKKSSIFALDLSEAMLQQVHSRQSWYSRFMKRIRPVCGDAESLPIADASCDMVISNLTLQWCNDLDKSFAEIRRVLRPGGMLLFTTFGPDTLKELRNSWSEADQFQHVSRFIDMHDIGDALLRAGLAEPVMDVEHFTLTYNSVSELMKDLRAVGATNASVERRQGLTGKNNLRTMIDAYEKYRQDDVLPASYEVVYGHAWAPVKTGQQQPPEIHIADITSKN
jgi:malonyl-CoA O-methyltransferase